MLSSFRDPSARTASRSARLARRPGVERFEARALMATLSVTNVTDSGAGSLRQAILDSNAAAGADTIAFSIGSGRQTIIPASPLPQVTDTVAIDATTQPGYAGTPLIELNGSSIFYPPTDPPSASPVPIPGVHGLVISAGGSVVRGLVINRFTGSGIVLTGSGQSQIAANYIGTDAAGDLPLGNGMDGVLVLDSRNNLIGGTSAADGNLISGNSGNGIQLTASGFRGLSANNRVLGNRIGTDASGTFDIGNSGYGVVASTGGNAIGAVTPAGAGNVIAFNGGGGVLLGAFYLPFGQQVRNSVLSNSIYSNALQGITVSYGAEVSVFGASLTSAFPLAGGGTIVQGYFSGSPETAYLIQIFANAFGDPSGAGEGQTLVGSTTVTTDSDGQANFEAGVPATLALNQVLSATATDPNSNTSGFFRNTRVAATAEADLVLVQHASPAPVLSGDKLTYQVTVTNRGPSTATGVTIKGLLPANAVFISAKTDQGTVSRDQRALNVAVGTLYSGESVTLTVVVTPTTGVVASSAFEASADQEDPTPDDNTSSIEVGITPDLVPPTVQGVRLRVGLRSINAIVLTFSKPLDPIQAVNPINFALQLVRGGQSSNNPHGTPVALGAPVYDPSAQTITLTPTKPLSLGKFYRLTLNGVGSAGITDLAGNLLVGNNNSVAGGSYVIDVSRGAATPHPTHVVKTPTRKPANVRLVESLVGRRVFSGPAGSVVPSSYTNFSNSFSS
ncbi:Ig-like domain-containing protein [Isosphaeraceae bacterium EP7]